MSLTGNEHRRGVLKIFELRAAQNKYSHEQRLRLKKDRMSCPRVEYSGEKVKKRFTAGPAIRAIHKAYVSEEIPIT